MDGEVHYAPFRWYQIHAYRIVQDFYFILFLFFFFVKDGWGDHNPLGSHSNSVTSIQITLTIFFFLIPVIF